MGRNSSVLNRSNLNIYDQQLIHWLQLSPWMFPGLNQRPESPVPQKFQWRPAGEMDWNGNFPGMSGALCRFQLSGAWKVKAACQTFLVGALWSGVMHSPNFPSLSHFQTKLQKCTTNVPQPKKRVILATTESQSAPHPKDLQKKDLYNDDFSVWSVSLLRCSRKVSLFFVCEYLGFACSPMLKFRNLYGCVESCSAWGHWNIGQSAIETPENLRPAVLLKSKRAFCLGQITVIKVLSGS